MKNRRRNTFRDVFGKDSNALMFRWGSLRITESLSALDILIIFNKMEKRKKSNTASSLTAQFVVAGPGAVAASVSCCVRAFELGVSSAVVSKAQC